MRGLALVQQTFWISSILAQAVLAIRLWWINGRAYRAFIAYLGFATVGSLVLLAFPVNRPSYARAWISVQIPEVVLLYVSAFEIFNRLAGQFAATDRRGQLSRYGRRILAFLMAASVLICAVSATLDARALKNKIGLAAVLAFALLLKRVATSTLAVFLVLSAWYFSRYRSELQPNLRWHGLFFTAWMSTSALHLSLRSFTTSTDSILLASISFLASSIAIYVAWTLLLTKRGEQMPPRADVSEQEGADKRTEWETLVAWLARLRSQRP